MKSRYVRNDPYFNDVPYDIIKDECGRVIAEVYVTAESLLPKKEREWSIETNRRNKRSRSQSSRKPKRRR